MRIVLKIIFFPVRLVLLILAYTLLVLSAVSHIPAWIARIFGILILILDFIYVIFFFASGLLDKKYVAALIVFALMGIALIAAAALIPPLLNTLSEFLETVAKRLKFKGEEGMF
ncbi:MAG: hypothetical protein IJM37_01935 [Lachnospiraceae bacterium]|nr:hypothetical protein [Lachnospiraceae bacterium]